ncbi:MAG TPA: glycosyl hydrolase 115 family protein [Sphingomonas sp.]|nr:glycosyl hydrolase 115 family protein [Sphingomonas sp.]
MRIGKRQLIKGMAAAGAAAAVPGSAQARGVRLAIRLDTSSAPVRLAANDLARDIEAVLGAAPVFANQPESDRLTIAIRTTGEGDRETFSLSRRGRTITLAGADMRGTIYAIYQFSQDYLGVDPMAFWTDNLPARRNTIDMPDGAERRFPKPVFDYRGFFINDEDQLAGWAPAAPGAQTNIAPAVMDKIYETLLRLKANMVVPSTWPFPDDLQIKAASARGLIVNQHHATPVGMNAVRWPNKVPYNFTDHPDVLRRAWKNAVDLYDPDQEILWTVGLRGLSDMPYAELDPNVAGDDRKKGAVIERAIAEQMKIVRARFPDAKFVTNLWSEGAGLMREGNLTIPDDVICAWPDEGWGWIKDNGQVRAGQGFYYHVAMLNGRANQLSEMVPVDRIHAEFGRFIKAGATRFALVNVSDLRAVAMTAKTTMDIAWGGLPDKPDARATYRTWAAAEFGADAADPAAEFYAGYFAAFPRMPAGKRWGDGMEYGEQRYHELGRTLLLRTMIDPPYYRTVGQSPTWWAPRVQEYGNEHPERWIEAQLARDLVTCAEAAPRWDALLARARAIEPRVVPERRDYFRYAVLTMLAANRNSNAMLLAICRSIRAARAGKKDEAQRQADAALAQIAELRRYQAYGAVGKKWEHWWRGEWLTDIPSTAEMIATFKRWIDDPINTTPLPISQSDWKAYYHILRYQGTRSVDVS